MPPDVDPGKRSVALVPSAHALTLFRGLPNGEGRAYTATTFPRDPWQGCERTIRTAMRVGRLTERVTAASYGVLDVLDQEGDIVQDYGVPDSISFSWLKRRLDLRVEAEPDA